MALVVNADGRSSNAFTRARAAADCVADRLKRVLTLSALGEAMTQAGDRRAGGVFDDAVAAQWGLQGWEVKRAIVGLAAAMERAGDPRARKLFDQALAASPQ